MDFGGFQPSLRFRSRAPQQKARALHFCVLFHEKTPAYGQGLKSLLNGSSGVLKQDAAYGCQMESGYFSGSGGGVK
jgi:hypothetical protein